MTRRAAQPNDKALDAFITAKAEIVFAADGSVLALAPM